MQNQGDGIKSFTGILLYLMLDYFRNDTWHNWDSIAKVIDKCSPEFKAYFERTDASITFFGPKNIAFEKFFFWSANPSLDVPNYNTASYTCIDEFSQDFCDQIVMSHLRGRTSGAAWC